MIQWLTNSGSNLMTAFPYYDEEMLNEQMKMLREELNHFREDMKEWRHEFREETKRNDK